MPYEGSYMWRLRQKVGNAKVFMPGVCFMLTDERGRVLLEYRRDFGFWALPGGSCELGESVWETLEREVQEETGLRVEEAQLIGLYTGPRYDVTYPNGNQVQNFIVAFHVTGWSGELAHEEAEAHEVRFWPLDGLPSLPADHVERLRDLANWDGTVIIK